MNEQEFWQALQPIPASTTVYKLYYDEQGRPIKYSVDNEPGNYIEVSVEDYLRSNFQVRIREGQIVYLKQPAIPRLVKSQQGTATHPSDITIIQTDSTTRWSLQAYEEN